MSSTEKLCLQWNDFKENIISSLKDLREDREFTDVTLACEDGQQVEAHKIVLVSSSPFFMELLKKNKHQHPLIYMRGLRSEDLIAIVDFLYCGEANVFQENLDSFLALAEELKLKGVTKGDEAEKEPVKETSNSKRVPLKTEKIQTLIANSNFEIPLSKGSVDRTVELTKDNISVDPQDLDEQIRSMITKSDISLGRGIGLLATCNVCGKEGPYRNMPKHVERKHINGVSHACDICGKISRTRDGVRAHKLRDHKSI